MDGESATSVDLETLPRPLAPEDLRAGDLLFLSRALVGVPAGAYLVVAVSPNILTICPAAANDDGRYCGSGPNLTIGPDDLAVFTRFEDTAMETLH
jgi:hypothetical protein